MYAYDTSPRSHSENITLTAPLPAATGPADLEAAVVQLAARHEVLRSSFAKDGNEIVQLVHPPFTDVALAVHQIEDDEGLGAFIEKEHLHRFDLSKPPLCNVTYLSSAAGTPMVTATLHHLICDGWSVGILGRAFGELLEQPRETHPRQPTSRQYREYCEWQRDWLTGSEAQRQLDYWLRWLDRPSAATLGSRTQKSHPVPNDSDRAADVIDFEFGGRLSLAARELGSRAGTTTFVTVASALFVLQYLVCGRRRLSLGVLVSKRDRSRHTMVGLLWDFLTLTLELDASETFYQLLTRTERTIREAWKHRELPFDYLTSKIAMEDEDNPFFEMVLNFNPAGPGRSPRSDTAATQRRSQSGGFRMGHAAGKGLFTRRPFVWRLSEDSVGIAGRLKYEKRLVDRDLAQSMVRGLATILTEAAANAAAPVSAYSGPS